MIIRIPSHFNKPHWHFGIMKTFMIKPDKNNDLRQQQLYHWERITIKWETPNHRLNINTNNNNIKMMNTWEMIHLQHTYLIPRWP